MRQTLAGIFLMWTVVAQAQQSYPYLNKFEIWGKLNTPSEKVNFLTGFTNGYFMAHDEEAFALYKCMKSVSYEQATAIVDKYYEAHPERWNQLAGGEIISALTVKDGPCPRPASAQQVH